MPLRALRGVAWETRDALESLRLTAAMERGEPGERGETLLRRMGRLSLASSRMDVNCCVVGRGKEG